MNLSLCVYSRASDYPDRYVQYFQLLSHQSNFRMAVLERMSKSPTTAHHTSKHRTLM
jgi:hypothetical protein